MSINNEGQEPAKKVVQSTEESPKKTNIEVYNEKRREEEKRDLQNAIEDAVEIKKQFYETLIATADPKTKGYAKIFYDKDDVDSALVILQENAKNQTPMPNTPTIPIPTGTAKIGLEKYMKYVPGTDKISWEIPASVLLDPEKNKKLGEYQ